MNLTGNGVLDLKMICGASVVKSPISYGYENDLFELAILKWKNDTHIIAYDTEISSDVIGNLTRYEVMELLRRIKDLEKKGD